MSGKYLLDSCFIIRWHEQHDDALKIIEQLNLQFEQCCYSVISHAELFSWQGLTAIDEHNLKALLQGVTRLAVTDEVIEQCITIRKQHKIKLPDALILATAKYHQLELLTLDSKLERLSKL